ncbi:MAG: efflux RND transporter periplasmic adaptor subunit [Candidatus Gracilibacteria bacterium]|nr:efflux RND transporter periplasmic adaptor subunit [Candidatus Gracilibacteria bacterium]MDD2908918.1 efflux RND transporter periplasmic adaptor subunit [Candidatus Gracilibacteria bacterium]
MYIIIVGIGYSIYSYYFSTTSKTITVNKEYTVSTGSIENSIKVTGNAALVDEQTLKFNQIGTVTKLYFKDGSSVKKGQLIAELDKVDINNTIKQAELSLSDAQIKLADLLNGPEYKDILNSENNVTIAENKIPSLQNDLNNLVADKANKMKDYDSQIVQKKLAIENNAQDIANKESSLINSKNELATLLVQEEKGLTDYDVDLNKTISDAYTNAKKQIIDMENSLYDSDVILGISDSNKSKNDSYEVYLGAKDSSLKVKAENDWRDANSQFLITKTSYEGLNSSSQTSQEMIDFLNKLLLSYDKMTNLGKDGQEMMNASIISSNFSQSDIDSKSSVFSSITNSSQSNYSTLKSTIANILKLTDPELKKAQSTNTVNSKKQSIIDAELSLSKLKNTTTVQLNSDLDKLYSDRDYSANNYESQIKQKNLDIASAENSLEYARESLKVIKSGATSVELSQARNSVTKASLSLENAREGLEKYELTAPFDGTIRKIDFQVGDNLTADEQKYIYIENPNLIEISATLDQLDIVKISIGQKAKIVFDSYLDKEFIGNISEKDSTPSKISGVTSYTIKITLDKGDAEIYSSMTAKVSIIVEGKNDIIIIPTSYIETTSGVSYVIVKENGQEIKKEVAIGITDDANIEITEGLSKGDIIIKKITSTVKTSTTSLFSPGGNRKSNSSSSSTKQSSSSSGDQGGPPPGM